MTHLTVLALGSHGDILPCAILGQGLQAAGFSVRLIAPENFARMAAQYDLEFCPVPGDVEALLTSAGGVNFAESGQRVWKIWRLAQALFGKMATDLVNVLSHSRLWQTDAIINQLPGGLFGVDLAEKLRIPLLTASVIPMIRTNAFPMVAFPYKPSSLPGYNALTYRIAEQMLWSGFRRVTNQWRQETLGLAARPFLGTFSQAVQTPTLLGFSEAIVPRPPDWGPNVHYAGYWRPEDPAWTPPTALVNFLEAGAAPVFVGFGSMPVRQPQQVTQNVLEALQQTGQRAVLQAGWAGLGQIELPETVYLLDYAPYGWLFPKMAAVIHHGGSGTTGFGIWAGVPTILTPFLFDQFYWGWRIESLGIGPKPIPFKKLTAAKLAEAIETAVYNPQMRQRAAELGQVIRQEDGISNAVKLVEQIVHTSER